MAKNIQIFFVYNANSSENRGEIYNPSEGILYFFPEWVSVEQKGALCGQIIGTLQCMKNIFSKPDIISLHNGKFIIIETGKLYFVIGTDKNVPSTFLQYLSKTLYSSLKFFLPDDSLVSLGTIPNNNGLLQRMHDIFDGYLKMLNFSCKIHSQTPMPKNSSDIFMEAMKILDCCRNRKNALGGTIIYRNRKIATQLSTELTQLLLMASSVCVQCPSVVKKLEFKLSKNAKVYEVFISNKDYSKLIEETEKNNLFEVFSKAGSKKTKGKSLQKTGDKSVLSTIQREQSLILTSVPEDESVPTFKQTQVPSTKKPRPRFLNLENAVPRTNTMKNLKQFSFPHSSSQIIVCTPQQEQKKIVHFNPLLICNNEAEDKKKISLDSKQIEKINSRNNNSEKNVFVPFDRKSTYYKTLADPTFPKFRSNGKLMSYYLFKEKYAPDSQDRRRFIDLDNTNFPGNARRPKNFAKTPMISSFSISSGLFSYKFRPNRDNKTAILPTPTFEFPHKLIKKPVEVKNSEASQKSLLLIWQHEEIVLTLLLKIEACEEKETLETIDDLCERRLTKLETRIRNNVHLPNFEQEKEMNKFVILDSFTDYDSQSTVWDTADDEWRSMNYFEKELNISDLAEVLIRSDENVFYGYRCGPTKVFFSETSNSNGGLPPPADSLSVIQVKAKRKLERDCSLILL